MRKGFPGMARRFSGDVRLTVSGSGDEWTVKLKAQGCAAFEGPVILEKGFCSLHGEEDAIDMAAKMFLQSCEDLGKTALIKTAAKTKKNGFHIGRDMAYRFPGERSDRRTK